MDVFDACLVSLSMGLEAAKKQQGRGDSVIDQCAQEAQLLSIDNVVQTFVRTCICVVLVIVGKQDIVLGSHGSVDEMFIFEFFKLDHFDGWML